MPVSTNKRGRSIGKPAGGAEKVEEPKVQAVTADIPTESTQSVVASAPTVFKKTADEASAALQLAKRVAAFSRTLLAPTTTNTPVLQLADADKKRKGVDPMLQAVKSVALTTFADKVGGKSTIQHTADEPKLLINAKGVEGRFDGAAGITHVFATSSKPLTMVLPYAAKEGIEALTTSIADGKSTEQTSSLVRKSALLNDAVEQKGSMPVHQPRKKSVPLEKRATIGGKWFNMGAAELTPELKKDLMVLRNREYLDPKRHYKGAKTELSGPMPRFFSVGTVQAGAHEPRSAQLTRKERKTTLVGALLADEKFTQYVKKQTLEVARKAEASRNFKRKSHSKRPGGGGGASKRPRR